jgi:hypothetical protein
VPRRRSRAALRRHRNAVRRRRDLRDPRLQADAVAELGGDGERQALAAADDREDLVGGDEVDPLAVDGRQVVDEADGRGFLGFDAVFGADAGVQDGPGEGVLQQCGVPVVVGGDREGIDLGEGVLVGVDAVGVCGDLAGDAAQRFRQLGLADGLALEEEAELRRIDPLQRLVAVEQRDAVGLGERAHVLRRRRHRRRPRHRFRRRAGQHRP